MEREKEVFFHKYVDGNLALSAQMISFGLLDKECIEVATYVFRGCRKRGIFSEKSRFDSNVWQVKIKKNKYREIDFSRVCKEFCGYPPYEVMLFVKIVAVSLFDRLKYQNANGMINRLIETIANWQHENVNLVVKEDDLFLFRGFFEELNIDEVKVVGVKNKNASKARALPPFGSYYIFDELIERFWRSDISYEQRMTYAPLYLFWRIANVIPTRPTEFIGTPWECTLRNKSHLYLMLRKCKIKGSGYKVTNVYHIDYPVKDFETIQEIFDLMNWYQEENKNHVFVNNKDDIRLFSTYWYDKHFGTKSDEEFTTSTLKKLLDRFYIEIIQNEYGYQLLDQDFNQFSKSTNNEKKRDSRQPNVFRKEIGSWNLGDLRHLAIINMIKRGVDPVYIAHFAGQDELETQYHYAQNIPGLLKTSMELAFEAEVIEEKNLATGDYGIPVDGGFCTNHYESVEESSWQERAYECRRFNHCKDGCKYFRVNRRNSLDNVCFDSYQRLCSATNLYLEALLTGTMKERILATHKLQNSIEAYVCDCQRNRQLMG